MQSATIFFARSLQPLPESNEFTANPGFDSSDWNPEDFGDIGMGLAVNNGKEQARSPFWLQCLKIGPESRAIDWVAVVLSRQPVLIAHRHQRVIHGGYLAH
jgi:hypothetical protein